MRTFFRVGGLLCFLSVVAVACVPVNPAGSTPPPVSSPAPAPASPTGRLTPQATTTPLRIPPNIPFDHAARTQCFSCHNTGADGAAPLPHEFPDHRQFPDDRAVCERCHPVVH